MSEEPQHRPRFDWTINLGHVLTATMMMFGGVTVWLQSVRLQERQNVQIVLLQERAEKQELAVQKVAEIQQKLALSQERVVTQLELMARPKL